MRITPALAQPPAGHNACLPVIAVKTTDDRTGVRRACRDTGNAFVLPCFEQGRHGCLSVRVSAPARQQDGLLLQVCIVD